MIRPADLNPGDSVYSWRSGITEEELASIPRNKLLQVGNCLKLKDIPIGTTVHAIAIKRDGPAQFCRSAGTSAVLIAKSETMAQIRLTSKEVRLVSLEACATIGVVGNENHKLANLGKAGAKRRKGIRPTVRGIAMNAVDHPHGGTVIGLYDTGYS
jgi:ribosomal protein L2